MRGREALAEDHLFGAMRLGQAAEPQVEAVEEGLDVLRQRDELRCRGLLKPRYVQKRQLGDPRLDRRDAGELRDLGCNRLRRPPHQREHVGEAVALVIGNAGVVERAVRPHRHDERGDSAAYDQRDRERLRPEPL